MREERARIPPGQVVTRKWPVLHHGDVPRVDLATWTFRVWGLVEEPRTWTWEEFQALPRERVRVDIHCVTRWSRLDTEFEGVPARVLLDAAGALPEARHVLVHAEAGFTTNLPLEDLLRENVLLADRADGEPLTPEHGWPLRLVVPHLYFWKSAKWVRGFELLHEERLGFWERNGYHRRGDPWKQERYWDD
ncbi:sulfite oxidase-like oxidoreductase [Caldinitratiruptor microaerophilus]|uniref:Oxidoreductase n=1 Tax=Caldinitratiruptor microaerophilus TaxID=671077 RepID=A0AA35CKE1_9FIRM|nr:sulfite oxidase-like oxidoreductase [Caldinitratiruptor microaerophilus]BDG60929.1 oxidoreductase [Caldinitratiruptor microaerophilus]